MILPLISSCAAAGFLYASYRYSLLMPRCFGLPILMYHKIDNKAIDNLTVSTEMFERHLKFLQSRNYTSLSFQQLYTAIQTSTPLPQNPVIITFDDGYANNFTHAFPLLKKMGFHATILLTVGAIGKKNTWDDNSQEMLTISNIHQMVHHGIEFGFHTFDHSNYKHLTSEQIIEDIRQCSTVLEQHNIPYTRVLAFPYGGYPKDPQKQQIIQAALQKQHILFGLLIKSKINPLPLRNPLALKRVKMEGRDSFFEFKIKLLKGRTKLFA